MKGYKRTIEIYEYHFWDFYNGLDAKTQAKVDWVITIIQTTPIVPEKFFKHLKNSKGLWEIRVSGVNGIYRILCFFEKNNLIVVLGGFQKKTQKTPKMEIKKAERLRQKYYDNK